MQVSKRFLTPILGLMAISLSVFSGSLSHADQICISETGQFVVVETTAPAGSTTIQGLSGCKDLTEAQKKQLKDAQSHFNNEVQTLLSILYR